MSPLSVLLAQGLPGLPAETGTERGQAQDSEADPLRPITELLDDYIDAEPLLWFIENLLEPMLQVLLILALVWLALRFARRGIRRVVERAKEQEPGARRGADTDDLVAWSIRRAQRAEALGALLRSIVVVVIWTVGIFMILGVFGYNLAPLIAGAGIVGIAIGFGAQDLVKDFLAGVFMLVEDQYGVGDIIDAGEAVGVVEGVTLRTTRIRDVQGTLWHVPNGEIRRIGNMSQEWARALLDVSVSYGTDVDVASDLIQRIASEMAHEEEYEEIFLDEPEIWGVEALAADGVSIRLVIKTQPGKQWAIARELRRRIKAAFDAADVEIPFPQRTVWLRTEQPVALGDAATPTYREPVPPESKIERAVRASKQGDTGAPDGMAELLPADTPDEEQPTA